MFVEGESWKRGASLATENNSESEFRASDEFYTPSFTEPAGSVQLTIQHRAWGTVPTPHPMPKPGHPKDLVWRLPEASGFLRLILMDLKGT